MINETPKITLECDTLATNVVTMFKYVVNLVIIEFCAADQTGPMYSVRKRNKTKNAGYP